MVVWQINYFQNPNAKLFRYILPFSYKLARFYLFVLHPQHYISTHVILLFHITLRFFNHNYMANSIPKKNVLPDVLLNDGYTHE